MDGRGSVVVEKPGAGRLFCTPTAVEGDPLLLKLGTGPATCLGGGRTTKAAWGCTAARELMGRLGRKTVLAGDRDREGDRDLHRSVSVDAELERDLAWLLAFLLSRATFRPRALRF
jgi:hypothetical protein